MSRTERRRHQRFPVRFPCQIWWDGGVEAATVRDVSSGGLSVECKADADQGESVRVRLEPPERPPIDIEALIWNVRVGRSRKTGSALNRVGLVLSEAPREFETLVRGKTPQRPPPPPEPVLEKPAAAVPLEGQRALPPPEPEPPAEEPLQRFRARVTRRGTSRTRAIVVFARCEADAVDKALGEVGDDWSLLAISES